MSGAITAMPIRALLVNEEPFFRSGLRWALAREPDIEVVGEAGHALEALRLARKHRPTVVICSVRLASDGGVELARTLKVHLPQSAVIMVGGPDEEDLFEAIRVGASAYFLSTTDPQPLVDAVRRVASGERIVDEALLRSPAVASRVLEEFNEISSAPHHMRALFVPLTRREMDVLEYMARGNSNKQIARALNISDQTVKNHVTSILRKLEVNDRTEAVVHALRVGWITMHRERQ